VASVDFVDECKNRQAELWRVLDSIEDGGLSVGDGALKGATFVQ